MNLMEIEDKYSSGIYSRKGLRLVKGREARLWDSEGNEYIDCMAGVGVANVGHANPEIIRAINEQISQLTVCPAPYYYHESRARLLEKLNEITPPGLSKAFLCNSGTEAVEASLKFARAWTGKKKIIACMRSFHGRTFGALSATWKKKYKTPFEPLVPGFAHVPYGDLDRLEEEVSDDTAAVLLEPVQGEGGVYPSPEGYLTGVREMCDQSNVLLILDEVQTGFGRTGRMFACEHWRVTPDLMCIAKAMGGGVPIGACVMREQINLSVGIHGSTFGGNPLAAAAARAVIDYIQTHGLVQQAKKRGEYFLDGLEKLKKDKKDKIRQVRGLGLMIGLQLREKAGSYLDALIDRGVLALPAGATVVRFLPPLEITEAEIDQVLEALEDVLN